MGKTVMGDLDRDNAQTGRIGGRVAIYALLIFWAAICLFPIYWSVTTSFKIAPDVMQGHLIPFWDFQPDWKGLRSLGLSPDRLFETSTVREEFLKRFTNSVVVSVRWRPMGSAASPTGSARWATRTYRSSSSAS
jgi:ABC-type glycerol-3-phosphate transport system permease component